MNNVVPNSVKQYLRFITARTEQSNPQDPKRPNLGSGVMYCYKGHTYLLTAAHCAVDATKNPVTVECKINTAQSKFKKLNVCRVLPSVYDEEMGLDYAVLEIENPNNVHLKEGFVRLMDFENTTRKDCPTVTYGYCRWCRDGRSFDVRPTDEGLYWEVDMPIERRNDFKIQAEGISGAGVFNFADDYFECLGVFKSTRDLTGSGYDIAITNASAFQGLIDAQIAKPVELQIPQYKPLPLYFKRYCAQYKPGDFMHYAHTDEPKYTLLDFLMDTAGNNNSILHYVLIDSAQTGKSYELKQVCYQLYSSDYYVCFISVDKVSIISKDMLPSKEVLESGKRVAIVIDAIDESPLRYFQRNLNIIVEFANEHPLVPMVVSCRSGFLKENKLDGFINLYFADLSQDIIRTYVNQKFTVPKTILEFLQKPDVRGLCRTPLGLVSVLKILKESDEIPKTKSALYSQMIELHKLQIKESPSERTNAIFEKAKDGLGRIAISMLLLDKQQLSKEEIVKTLGGNTKWTDDCLEYYQLLLVSDGLYSFENHAYKEYLAAEYLSHQNLDNVQKIVCYDGKMIIKTQWHNVIMLWLQILSDSGKIPNEVWDWISTECRTLLLGCDKERISDELRLELFELIIQECKQNNRIYGYFYTNCYQQLYSFAETKDFKVVDYLIEELHNEKEFNTHLYDVMCLSACINWDALKAYDSNKYTTIVNMLFGMIQNCPGSEDRISCLYFLCVNQHFYANEHYFDRVFSILSSNKDVDSINAMCVIIFEGDRSDRCIDYLLEAETYLLQSGIQIEGREQLFRALSIVKRPDNLSRVISTVTNSDFVNHVTEYNDYHDLLKNLLTTAQNLIEQGYDSLMDDVNKSFNSLYLHEDSYFAGFVSAKVLDVFCDFYEQFNQVEMIRIIKDIQNYSSVDEVELQKSRARNQGLFEEMCDYTSFKDRISEVVKNYHDANTVSQICFDRNGGYDNYVAQFFILYSTFDRFDVRSIEQAINNSWLYELFRFYMIGEALMGRNPYVEVATRYIELCSKTAKMIINSIINGNKICDYVYIQQTIKLIITCNIAVEKNELIGLLPYSYEGASVKDGKEDWGVSTKSLFEFMAETFQVDELLPVIRNYLKDKRDRLQEPVILSMCKYMILNGTIEDTLFVFRLIREYEGKAIAHLILEALLEREDIIGVIMENIKDMDNGLILIIASQLIENNAYKTEIIGVLEKKLPHLEGFELRRALSFLFNSGSICALEYLREHLDLVEEQTGIFEFRYDDVNALQLMLDVLSQVYSKGDQMNISANLIIQSIGNIAERSEENYNIVKASIEELVSNHPELKFLLQFLPGYYERFLKRHESEMTIDRVASLLASLEI